MGEVEEKKVKLTFFLDNPKEDYPDVHLVQHLHTVQPVNMSTAGGRPPALPVGNRRGLRKKRARSGRMEADDFPSGGKSSLGEKKGTWLSLMMIVSSAVAVGLMMGMLVLSLFSPEEGDLLATREAQQREASAGQGDDLFTPGSYWQGGRMVIPSHTFFVAQAGAFSRKEVAEDAREQLHGKGLPAEIFLGEDSFNLYVAIGANRDDLERLERVMEKAGLEIYLKTHRTKSMELEMGDEPTKLKPLSAFLSASGQLVNQLLDFAVTVLVKEKNLTEENLTPLKTLHRQVLLEGQQAINVLDEEIAQQVEGLMREQTVALSALEAYIQKPNPAYVWQILQAGLNYLASYEALLDQLEKFSNP